jgi:hypothetical protein
MKRVTGIGGVFFKSKDPKKITEWYQKHLGLDTNPYGATFEWYEKAESTQKAQTQWSPFPETTTYFVSGFSANGACVTNNAITVTVLKDPNLNNFENKTKTFFDGTYTISPPTSLSLGTFSFTSSDPTVATIIGSTVTITGPGTTTITALQNATATHFSGTINATLTVNSVTVLTRNGKISTSDANYVNKNGVKLQ